MGNEGQYYVLKTNGKFFYSGCEEFMDLIESKSSCCANLVALGDWHNYVVQFDDGSVYWSEDVPEDVEDILNCRDVMLNFVWFSAHSPYEYAIGYDNGRWYKNLPDWLNDDVDTYFRHHSVKQLLVDEHTENFFIRYS